MRKNGLRKPSLELLMIGMEITAGNACARTLARTCLGARNK